MRDDRCLRPFFFSLQHVLSVAAFGVLCQAMCVGIMCRNLLFVEPPGARVDSQTGVCGCEQVAQTCAGIKASGRGLKRSCAS